MGNARWATELPFPNTFQQFLPVSYRFPPLARGTTALGSPAARRGCYRPLDYPPSRGNSGTPRRR
eukprot:5380546-Alexandrium_andersonii.AAC.1